MHNVTVKFFYEHLLGKGRNIAVNEGHSFDKVVVIDAAHEVRHEAVSYLMLDTREDELKEIVDARTKVEIGNILKNNIRANLFVIHRTFVFEMHLFDSEKPMGYNSKTVEIARTAAG